MVAHPDDEILWFSSILDECKRVVVCFGPSATSKESWDLGRARLIEAYPLAKVKFLKLRQSGGFNAANWNNPEVVESGLRLRGSTSVAYENNAHELSHILGSELAPERVIFTHNPWGEYGHEEHVQVFRVLAGLRERIGFELLVDSYVSNKSAKLMNKSLHLIQGCPSSRETDRTLARQLKNLYVRHECWTYQDDFEWPEFESFYRVVDSGDRGAPASASVPLNVISRNYDTNPVRNAVKNFVPASVKSAIKNVLK